jgi:hypothetical protein
MWLLQARVEGDKMRLLAALVCLFRHPPYRLSTFASLRLERGPLSLVSTIEELLEGKVTAPV